MLTLGQIIASTAVLLGLLQLRRVSAGGLAVGRGVFQPLSLPALDFYD